MLKCIFLLAVLPSMALGSADVWDLAPIRYSDTQATDAVATLAADLASGKTKVEGETELEQLDFVLRTLGVSAASQMLVYSKTSHQNPLIRPSNPRALYFSMNAYVGYVPGGDIEAIVQDRLLGPVFYLIHQGEKGGLKIERDLTSCISCHGTTATSNVPGMQVRSVIPDEDGHPLLAMGTSQVDHRTPVAQRWGGYYVSGRASMPHLGNRVYQKDGVAEPAASKLMELSGVIDATKYLRPTSDVVALMVLEHQCRMHNLLTAAAMRYRRAFHLGRAADSQGNPDEGAAGRVADGMADDIVNCLFFKDEADPGEDTEGAVAFQKAFAKEIPRTADGRSLVDFRLYQRLFKYRCSYMVYSDAFKEMPPRVRKAVQDRMKRTLAGKNPAVDWLSASERKRISAILAETLPGW
jgi:hypothetical protein